MADYPETVREFRAWFPDEAACRAYLEKVRWPAGPRCPRCPQAEVWKMQPPFYRCALCRHDFTVTAGTLFADTRLPLTVWFEPRKSSWVSCQRWQMAVGMGYANANRPGRSSPAG